MNPAILINKYTGFCYNKLLKELKMAVGGEWAKIISSFALQHSVTMRNSAVYYL